MNGSKHFIVLATYGKKDTREGFGVWVSNPKGPQSTCRNLEQGFQSTICSLMRYMKHVDAGKIPAHKVKREWNLHDEATPNSRHVIGLL